MRARPEAPRPAEEVHHIVPAQKMIDRFGEGAYFDESNLICLCRACHDTHELAYRDAVRAEAIFGRRVKEWRV